MTLQKCQTTLEELLLWILPSQSMGMLNRIFKAVQHFRLIFGTEHSQNRTWTRCNPHVLTHDAFSHLIHPILPSCLPALCSVLCRDEAQKLWAERAALEALDLKVVCVVHEWIDREVSWPELT